MRRRLRSVSLGGTAGRLRFPMTSTPSCPMMFGGRSKTEELARHSGVVVVAGQSRPARWRGALDRLLVAQCILEKLPILTADPVFVRYGKIGRAHV